jgi:parallel beta-helix repeat protein
MKYCAKSSSAFIRFPTICILRPVRQMAGGLTWKLAAILLLGALCPLRATEYFVSNTGQDTAGGTDPQNAFLTIQHAVDVSKGGDTVTVLDGVYREAVTIYHSGDKSAPITIRSKNRWGAKVIALKEPENCFTIGGPKAIGIGYITIQGFDVNAPITYGSGVATYAKAHHITVENVYAHDCGSSGIQFGDGDYLAVRNCVCADNAFLMPYCGSGISMYGRYTADDAPGFHNIVSGNVCYGNNNGPKTSQTDGNGIVIDDMRDKQKYHTKDAAFDLNYQGDATLVENNLCFDNGGKGIIIYSSNNVTVVNNTCVRNMRRANQGRECGDITVSCCSHVVVANNIAVTSTEADNPANHPHNTAYVMGNNSQSPVYVNDTTVQGTIMVENNLSFDESKPGDPSFYTTVGLTVPFAGENGNLAGVDPCLINPDDASLWGSHVPPDTDFASYFGLKKNSPALAAGIKIEVSGLSGQKVLDLGAYQQSDGQ